MKEAIQVIKDSVKETWDALPQSVKTTLVIAEGGAAAAFLQLVTDPGAQVCFTKTCLKHYIGAVLAGAVIAVRMYYRLSPKQAFPIGSK
jgi:hypothetical protein